ncbi:lantibiotic dehydratase family protein [uncultured Tenacibaculum sp.]|uniref:lantibiotic dehydratase family protein n=1 Tax=uncultured Tenacibaculum sp. TaxID=174713 RepID=UPI00261C7C71|nr:lantibiotic dehydratase family protein [uncultured Tenacibaculum sp.]
MSKKNPYKSFSNYVLRTPLFPLSFFEDFTSKSEISKADCERIWKMPAVKESFFLASPDLVKEVTKWMKGEKLDIKKENKLKYSFLKYISRMSTRCTPFGLFAGCSLGNFDDKTAINLYKGTFNQRHTRFDMNYLVALAQDLVKNIKIKNQLLFYPNSSIYEVGDRLRYVEYNYVEGKRHHQIAEVDNSIYLEEILFKASKGVLLSDIISMLLKYDVSFEEADFFVDQLVDSQILISELEPSVSGPEFFEQMFSVLESLDGIDDIIKILREVSVKISKLDKKIGNDLELYYEIINKLKELNIDFDVKYLFQSDMVTNTISNTLDQKIINDIKKGFIFLSKLTAYPKKQSDLHKFKEAFYDRYENEEVKLSTALDVELGIGYIQNNGITDVNPLVDDLMLTTKYSNKDFLDIKWSPIYSEFVQLINKALKNNDYIIKLTDRDFKDFDADLNNLPDTISTIVEIVEKDKIRFSGAGGSSAANILGRFCHSNQEIKSYVEQIINVETKMTKDKILAEIVHLPESRMGNILCRPDFRSFEIPYLAKSLKSSDKTIYLEDLMISAKNKNKVKLFSKKYNKEIIPRLTSAHNYRNNSLPVYHFLSDMQLQDINGLGLDLGPVIREYEFIPRIEYNNLILSEATWNLSRKHLQSLIKLIDESDELRKKVNLFKKDLKVPDYVKLVDGDNELLINLNNLTSIKMFLNTVKNRERVTLKEFLFSEKSIITDKHKGVYTNQVVVSFYNEEKLKNIEKQKRQ